MDAALPLVLIRHGETAWNADGRIQGFSDVPLSDVGRAEVARWRLPAEFASFRWVASPLARARDTALILGAKEETLKLDHRIKEMHWGAWEGMTLDDLAADLALIQGARARGGLDFCAPGGESGRDMHARLGGFLKDVARAGAPTIAVAHKGVVRGLVSLATGWDMRGDCPEALDWSAAHLFHVRAEGAVAIARLNIPLAPATAPSAKAAG